jgi:hypothetical protein
MRRSGTVRFAGRWTAIFGGSMALFLVRFLVPSPVGMADNGDGPRLVCGLGVTPATHGFPRYDSYAFFTFVPTSACEKGAVYASSQHVLLVAARALTPLLGLSGAVNLIALGLITCALQSVGIASLACGLRLGWRGTIVTAAAIWLVMADAAFFDTYASPFSEGATLTGLLLVAAGAIYLGRGPLGFTFGLAATGAGGLLAALSKEQYVPLVLPICVMLVVASASRTRRGLSRLLTRRSAAAVLAAGMLGAAAAAYVHHDATNSYAQLLEREQVVDTIFEDIVTGPSAAAAADLRELDLPARWTEYAGTDFWTTPTVADDPQFAQYASKLTDANLVRFQLTHPALLVSIGQHAAQQALAFRVNYLGNYPPSAGNQPGALENRVDILSSIVEAVPASLGLIWLLQLWAAMAIIAIWALRVARQAVAWHRDAALTILLLIGCAVAAFIPAAYLDGIEVTRHMLGMNLATALACVLTAILLASMIKRAVSDGDPADQLAGPVAVSVPRQPGASRVPAAHLSGNEAPGPV